MFCPKKRLAIGMLTVLAGLLIIPNVSAQSSSQYDARWNAMQAARERAQNQLRPRDPSADAQVRQTAYQQDYDYSEPPSPQLNSPAARVSRLPQNSGRSRNSNRVTQGNYTPQHLRTAQVYDSQIIDEGSTIVESDNIVGVSPMVSSSCCDGGGGGGGGGCDSCGGGFNSNGFGDDCSSGCGFNGCGLNGLLCRQCINIDDSCYGRGGCPPGTLENCWLFGLGDIFARGEYFIGSSAFKGPAFQLNGADAQLPDNNFGFYGGFNLGIPLCRLTCGLVSFQLGVRSVTSDYNGNMVSPNTRDQVFVTAGFYRRVDYGFQAGFVVDALHEEWFTISDTAQVRVDLGWVYLNGTTMGLRFATNSTNDVAPGIITGNLVDDLVTSTYDQVRFYWRYDCPGGGYTELYGGGADDSRGLFGLTFDIPTGERLAVQAGLNYIIAESIDGAGSTDSDSWNLYMGFSFRPRGTGWYKNYDRPLFDVADNGTYLMRRE